MAINVDDLKKLPLKYKALIVLGICLLLGYFYYMSFFQDLLAKQLALNTKLTEMEQQVSEKEKVVAQLDQYIREVSALKESFALALLKLPNAREIAGLLASMVLSGRGAGIEFLLFEPQQPPPKPPPEEKKPAKTPASPAKPAEPEKFFDEIPVKMQLAGSYHNTVSFYSKIAQMPRIVNIEDFVMEKAKDVKGRGRVIQTSCTIVTYKFIDKTP